MKTETQRTQPWKHMTFSQRRTFIVVWLLITAVITALLNGIQNDFEWQLNVHQRQQYESPLALEHML